MSKQQSTIERVAKAYGVLPHHAASLFRAPPGSKIYHEHNDLGWHTVSIHHPETNWSAETSVHPEMKKLVYHLGFGKPGSNNSLHTVKSLITARDLGIQSAHIHNALGGPTGNGAYTMPRLGFSGALDPVHHKTMVAWPRPRPEVPVSIVHATDAKHLVAPGAARDYWRHNHYSLRNLHFDTRPGSDSFHRLHEYLKERAAQGKPTS